MGRRAAPLDPAQPRLPPNLLRQTQRFVARWVERVRLRVIEPAEQIDHVVVAALHVAYHLGRAEVPAAVLGREMEDALREFISTRASQVAPAGCVAGTTRAQLKVDNAGAAFDRVMARQTGVSGLVTTVTANAAQLKELQELQRSHRVEERLAKLRASIPQKQ